MQHLKPLCSAKKIRKVSRDKNPMGQTLRNKKTPKKSRKRSRAKRILGKIRLRITKNQGNLRCG